MSRMRYLFASLASLVAAMSGLAPSASAAASAKVIASGSSAMWQTMALAAYNNGQCVLARAGLNCFHYTDSASFELHDTRPGKREKNTPDAVDRGDIWIVWDNTAGPNVWAYIKVDSVVGNRCFFANPTCTVKLLFHFRLPGTRSLLRYGAATSSRRALLRFSSTLFPQIVLGTRSA